jgi:penicillin amidase
VPAIDEAGEPPLSMRWVGAEHLDDIRASINISRAKDWKSFRKTLSDWAVAVFNFCYADAKGNIGYQMAGRVPVRGRVTHGLRDASNPLDRWIGYVPYEGLPHRYNPAQGYVASANQRIVPPNFPHVIYGAYSQGHRGIRIDQTFASGPADQKHTVGLQNDIKNVRAERLVPKILAALSGRKEAEAGAVVKALTGWDYTYAVDSIAPTMFETFMFHWARRVIREHMPERLLDLTAQQTGLAVSLLEDPSLKYFKIGDTTAELAKAAADSVASLTERLGADASGWKWGVIHKADWKHTLSTPALAAALDIGPASVNGGSHTVRNNGGELPPHAASSGAEYRIVVDFAKPDSFLAVQNIGNSGVPGSPHYRDQFMPWIRGEYHTVQLKRAAVEADLESRTQITP